MKLKQWLAVIGAMGVAMGAGGCAPKTADGETPPADAGLVSQQDTSGVAKYLGKDGPVDQFNDKVIKSICQLEEKNKVPEDERLCKNGDPETVGKPTYPPK
ncbi:MAG TPA: hypothetical protein VJQ44_01495 [Gemmatimonadales bacterium]|nr:hypothetical protein [Gemmatimonadales bacterium]